MGTIDRKWDIITEAVDTITEDIIIITIITQDIIIIIIIIATTEGITTTMDGGMAELMWLWWEDHHGGPYVTEAQLSSKSDVYVVLCELPHPRTRLHEHGWRGTLQHAIKPAINTFCVKKK